MQVTLPERSGVRRLPRERSGQIINRIIEVTSNTLAAVRTSATSLARAVIAQPTLAAVAVRVKKSVAIPAPIIDTTADQPSQTRRTEKAIVDKSPRLYWYIVIAWIALLATTLLPLYHAVLSAEASGWPTTVLVILSTLFIAYFWLNGMKDLVYTLYYHLFGSQLIRAQSPALQRRYHGRRVPKVVLVYCTYNDFNAASLSASMEQRYPHYEVVILDDSTKPEYWRRWMPSPPSMGCKLSGAKTMKGLRRVI